MSGAGQDAEGAGKDVESDIEDLYERAPCALLSTLPDGTIIRANQTFFDWFGSSREELLGQKRFQSLLTVGSRLYYETHYSPLLQIQGFAREIALEIRRADGAIRPVVASARQFRRPDGTPHLNRVALFDSTDRRSYEKELLRARTQNAHRAPRWPHRSFERRSGPRHRVHPPDTSTPGEAEKRVSPVAVIRIRAGAGCIQESARGR
jgi:PAS domain S-box-containing protein